MAERFPGRPAGRFGGDRPGDRGPRPPFRGPGDGGDRPRPAFRPPTDPPSSVRIRDGEREIEVQGNPAFVRQILDELPALLRRLDGDTTPVRESSIRMPQPAVDAAPPAPAAVANGNGHAQSEPADLETEVLAVLAGEKSGLNVAEIRGRLGGATTGQQVRRILERAGKRVTASADRPARYRLR